MGFFSAYKLRKASDTIHLEKKRDELEKDFEEFNLFTNSEELKVFKEIEAYILSDNFKKSKKAIENKSFKKSSLYIDEKKVKRLEKSKRLKIYFRLKDSAELHAFNTFSESAMIYRYHELKQLIRSQNFNKKEQAAEWNEYKKLKKSRQVKNHFKFEKSKSLKTYREVDTSQDLKLYYELKDRIISEDFKKEKAFLLDKKRFEGTEDFKKLEEYTKLKESDKYKKYFALLKKNNFTDLKKWELSFSEEFEGDQLNKEKWINNYYWADELLNKTYSLESDLHIFTDGKNIEMPGSSAVLLARKEKMQGLLWKPTLGFVPKEFNYTSAIISTGKFFQQKYGRFEAKVKLSNANHAVHSFWMVSGKKTPHIDIFKSNSDGKLRIGNYWSNTNKPSLKQFKIRGVDLSKGYFIYTLEWSENELVWKINDVVVKKQSEGVPQEEMYLNFSLAVTKEQANLNAALEIDWLRCYKRKE